MAPQLIIVANGPGDDLCAHLGDGAAFLYSCLLADTIAVAQAVAGRNLVVAHSPAVPPAALRTVGDTPLVAIPARVDIVTYALDLGLSNGSPVLLLRDHLPHLPPWRLRDAITRMLDGVPVVLGPSDRGGWYLFGLHAAARAQMPQLLPIEDSLISILTAQIGGHAIHLLPPWFGVTTLSDLATLLDLTRTMPTNVAAQTRALLESNMSSRAVGG